MSSSYIFIGVILGPFGIEGGIRFKSFADSENSLKSYKIFYNSDGTQEFKVKKIRSDKKDTFVIYFETITSRTEAENFKNQQLYIDAAQLRSLKEDEYYHHYLIDSDVFNENKTKIGTIKKITDYGSGDLLEVFHDETGSLLLIPFNANFIKDIHLETRQLIIHQEDINMFLTLNGSVQ
ncbi:MAG: ribosome maturation factor RimM [Janthinobacterium lividum]